ncbi:hypothetical protein [Halalkalibacter lacteus]
MFVSIIKVIIIPIALGITVKKLLPAYVDKGTTVMVHQGQRS